MKIFYIVTQYSHFCNKAMSSFKDVKLSVRNFVSAQKCIMGVYVGSSLCKTGRPELTPFLHPYYKVSSSTRPSSSLVFHDRPDDMFAIEKSTNIRSCPFFCQIRPSKGIYPVHWGREFTGTCVISLTNVCDCMVILDYLILLKTWNRFLQINMKGNSCI